MSSQKLLSAARALVKRAAAAGELGETVSAVEFDRLSAELGLALPKWMFDLYTSCPLCGLCLGWQSEPPDDNYDGIAPLRWSDASDIRSESLDAYPGLAIKQAGYVSVGCCLVGSGNPYFVNIHEGSDPPLYRVQHDISDQPDAIIARGRTVVAPTLSQFFKTAVLERS